METIDTLIIGAGPAGLTTAYRLAKAGHGVLVIEQDKHYVDGISRTISYKGFLPLGSPAAGPAHDGGEPRAAGHHPADRSTPG